MSGHASLWVGARRLWVEAPHIKSPPSIFVAYWSSASGDIYLICNVTSQDHGIEGSYNFISRSSSLGVPIMSVCHVISQDTAFERSFDFKSALPGLRPFLTTESPLKMMKNTFCFTSKVLFDLKIFKFLSWLFGHVEKRLDYKGKVDFKIYDVTTWLTSNCNTHINQYLKK